MHGWKKPQVIFFAASLTACLASAVPPATVRAEAGPLEAMAGEMEALAERVGQAVVQVVTERPPRPNVHSLFDEPFMRGFPGGGEARSSAGSGFFIDREGAILTTANVVEGAKRVAVIIAGAEREASIRGVDRGLDVAMLAVAVTPAAVATLGDSDGLKVGSPIMAVGNPFGLRGSVGWGVVSGRGRSNLGITEIEDLIQLSVCVNPGDSGGPVCNVRGEVVGIIAAGMGDAGEVRRAGGVRMPQGIAFAIPINMAKELLPRLKSGGEIEHGWLGVGIQALTPALQQEFGIKDGRGVLIARVVPSGPAESAGLREGDVVRSFAGKPVSSPRDLIALLAVRTAGEKAAVTFIRGGEERTAEVVVARRGGASPEAPPAGYRSGLGLAVETITPRLAERYNLPEGETGVVVTGVEPGSPAAKSGIRKGDFIREANRGRIATRAEWEAAAGRAKPGDKMLLRTQRGFFVIQAE